MLLKNYCLFFIYNNSDFSIVVRTFNIKSFLLTNFEVHNTMFLRNNVISKSVEFSRLTWFFFFF